MAISNIASVTRTLIALIKQDLKIRNGLTVDVTAAAPDVTVNTQTVSVHLLQIIETGEFRNIGLGSPGGPVPVQHTLMGLALQYVITVVPPSNTADDSDEALDRQRITGHIARTLHDYPVITTNTKIPAGTGLQILNDELFAAGDSIQFILRPAPLQETISFWTTQDSKLARLCLFVEARVAVLEPLPPVSVAGTVLSVGSFVFPATVPTLTAVNNVLKFTPPGAPALSSVRASPARVAIVPTALTNDPPLSNARLTLEGVGLFPGQRTLILQRRGAKYAIDFDAAPPANAAWRFDTLSGALALTFRDSVTAVLNDDPLGASTHPLVPGTYSARIAIRREAGAPLRSTNELAFSVIPQLAVPKSAAVSGSAPGPYTVTVLGTYLLDPTLEVELALSGVLLTRSTSAPAAGQFQTDSASTVTFVLPNGFPTPAPEAPAAIRLVVNGAVATPEWLTS